MSFIKWLHASGYATFIRNSDSLYPILQIIHLCGIAIAIGSVLIWNARLLGLGAGLSLQDLTSHARRWAAFGVLLILLSGINMAVSFFAVFSVNPVMWIKLTMLLIAGGVNVTLYRRCAVALVDPYPDLPSSRWVKTMAGLSILLLLSAIVMGKLLAYIGSKD